jgi:hypothetical protein
MFSQYWSTALTVELEQGAPGWFDVAAADISGASSAAKAVSRQSRACLAPGSIASLEW